MDTINATPLAIPSPSYQRMQELVEKWETLHDKRAIFLTCYTMMTANMLACLEKGEFEDPEWVHRLLERFADYYFIALDGYEAGTQQAPQPWQFAFEAAVASHTPRHVLQHLVLGVNAHINYDLVFVLGDMLLPEWAELAEEKRQLRYRDHCRVNDVIASTTDRVQDQIIERYSTAMGWVDTLFGAMDEWIIARLITRWRESVWEDAVHIVELASDSSAERERLVQLVEKNSIARAQAILGQQGLSGLFELIS